MSKPWYGQETPLVEKLLMFEDEDGDRLFTEKVVQALRETERRMRAAEALMAKVVAGYESEKYTYFDWIEWYEDASQHLDAAKEMDGGK
jgi:hypothetical protein